MGQHDAGRGELRSWHTMNEDREYDLAGSSIADNDVPSNSPPRLVSNETGKASVLQGNVGILGTDYITIGKYDMSYMFPTCMTNVNISNMRLQLYVKEEEIERPWRWRSMQVQAAVNPAVGRSLPLAVRLLVERSRILRSSCIGIGEDTWNATASAMPGYIDDRNYDYLKQETDANGKARPDRRIHCCLYFIEPTGHGLKRLDIECMRKLHDRVNVIPVIAKADTMTTFECYRFKKRLLREIAEHHIKFYEFPEVKAKDEQLRSLKHRLPFAIVSSNTVVEENGRKMLARRYPWGIAEIENLEHSDFCLLRKVLLQTHLHDLKEATNVHYESFRCRKLAPIAFDDFKNVDRFKRKKYKY
ncbi:Protein peanut [Gryllus bimaculatus]|nr:Protein peanut [Gryllus bimaculatus]